VVHILDELRWRGVLAQSTDEQALREALSAGPVTLYCGFDPTAPSLHIGNLVQILTLRRMQDAGHRPLGLVGGATGLIGDPKMTAERTLNSPEVVAGWVERIKRQIEPLLRFDGPNAARMVNNLDWTAGLSAIDFLRDVGKHYRMGTMLAKETVARRLASEQGISFTEFSYQILQGMDFLELYRRHGCTLQSGGSDQWGNLLSGVELTRKVEGVAVHALATPLITKADGTKFGKTESGTVWLDPDMTSPYAFYQFWLNQADSDVVGYLKVFTFRTSEEIADLERAVAERPQAREAQRVLAEDVTTLVHGADATRAVVAASQALFGRGDLASLDERTLRGAVAELPRASLGDAPREVVDLLVEAGLVASRGAGRRAIAEGGVSVNNVRVTAEDALVGAGDLLHGRWALLRRGKRSLAVAARPAQGA
jgi:tyrosyl-tRNA synthetase